MISAPRATLDRTLGQLLFDRPRFGTLLLDRAALDIERRPDGTVDVYETIKPVLNFDPQTHVKIVVQQGHLRFRGAPVSGPLVAEPADVTLEIGPAPKPITWQLDLKQSPRQANEQAPAQASLAISGRYERWWERTDGQARTGLAQGPGGQARWAPWPLAFDGAGLAARGVLDGGLAFARRSGLWSSSGDATLSAFEVDGPLLAGDQLRLERITGSWDLAENDGAGAWVVRRLDLKSPIATLTAAGPLPAPPGTNSRIEGTLDLAALAQQLPHAAAAPPGITLENGAARPDRGPSPELRRRPATDAWEVDAHVSDLQARDGGRALHAPVAGRALGRLVKIGQGTWALQRACLADGLPRCDRRGRPRCRRSPGPPRSISRASSASFATWSNSARSSSPAKATSRATTAAGDELLRLRVGIVSGPPHRRPGREPASARRGPPRSRTVGPGQRRWDSPAIGAGSSSSYAPERSQPISRRRRARTRGHPDRRGSLRYADRKGRLEGRVSGHWDQTAAVIELARVALVPEGPESRVSRSRSSPTGASTAPAASSS